jgi:hypothetical protein
VLADFDIAGADIAGADIAGADVDCDIAGPGLACFELLQAARAKAIEIRAAPFSAVDRMSFTFRFSGSRVLWLVVHTV